MLAREKFSIYNTYKSVFVELQVESRRILGKILGVSIWADLWPSLWSGDTMNTDISVFMGTQPK